MNPDEFMSLSINERLKTVNKMLEKEEKDHLRNVSKKAGIPYSAFTKIMRESGSYQYNQTSKKYEKLLSLEEYEQYLQLATNKADKTNETLSFLEEHLDELKKLLVIQQVQLILDPEVYDPTCSTVSKSFQVNGNIYNQFTELCSTQFPHLRQKDLVSQCLFDFVKKFQRTHPE